jgi:hypothetical protein
LTRPHSKRLPRRKVKDGEHPGKGRVVSPKRPFPLSRSSRRNDPTRTAAYKSPSAPPARRIGKKEPGFEVDYRLGEDTQREVIATAEAFLLLLDTPTAAKFIAYSMPATFVADLQADVSTITGKKGEQIDDRTGDAGETALTRTQVKQARELIADLNVSVRNKFRTNPTILAEWSTASRIHRTGRSKPDDTPPVPPVV